MAKKWLRNKNGDLSVYGFACGYIQDFAISRFRLKMFLDGACYHVQYFDDEKPFMEWNDIDNGRFWLSFSSLTDARKAYRKIYITMRSGKFDSNILTYGGL